MEEAKEAIKRALKVIFKIISKALLVVFMPLIIIIILLAGAVYFLTVDDGTYKEGDWSSTPYAAAQYENGIKVNDDGTMENSMTAQELWDKMIENGSRVDEYLDSPEELARLMRAETVTKYPDTRKDPDKEIDWEKVIADSDSLQGIIKFKRAKDDGTTSTMSYVSPETFQSYIDEYNKTGSETAKKNALNHFTLKRNVSTSTGTLQTIDGVSMQVIADKGRVTFYNGDGSAMEGGSHNALGTKLEDGQCALKGLRDYAPYHSVIYIETSESGEGSFANGKFFYVSDTGGGLQSNQVDVYANASQSELMSSPYGSTNNAKISLVEKNVTWEEYLQKYHNKTLGSSSSSDKKEDTSKEDDDDKDKKEDSSQKQTATVTKVDGDGYSEEYTSSAGITYKHYKQFEGSYANNSYWDGTIHSSGCGPTSVAILASGLTNLNYTPADIASQMNSTYGYTSYETLKGTMDSLGMTSEIIQSPSGEDIKNNLQNGKVMLVSVNSNTIFTGGSHIMALVDINTDGQVYICNPGSSTKYGWYDVSEITKGCKYIVVTDAGASGVALSSSNSAYTAVVATWKQVDTTITSNDPNVAESSETDYTMTTTNVNYEEMVNNYTMPFDMLWALLVVGEDKNFVFELADLIYGSDIQITVHDNLTVNTDIDEWNYTQKRKAVVDATITATANGSSATGSISNDVHDPHSETKYKTTKKVVTQTNTINVALTRANVWIVDYQNNYTYSSPVESTSHSTATKKDQEYPKAPNALSNTYDCEHISALRQSLKSKVNQNTSSQQGESHENNQTSSVSFDETIKAQYYDKYVDISDSITNKVSTQRYIEGVPTLKEKTDKDSKEDNFVTIFNKYRNNKSRIKDASSWLFEIIEINDSTKDMLDLIKYLLYKATGTSYGVEEFDFSIFYPGELKTVGEGDYIVHTEKSSPDIVIDDVETLKKAFSGYSGSSELKKHAQEFLDLQNKYKVNAVFAAAVSISETSAGRNGHATDGKNNWFNIECTCGGNHGRFETYSTAKESIEAFYKQISVKNYYFTAGKYTVSEIGMVYCENADAPGGWIETTTTYMTQMFKAAGIDTSSSSGTTEKGKAIVEKAKTKQGCPYKWGATGPNSFDCSGFTMWCYKQVGITIPRTSSQQKSGAKKVVSVSEARVGDVLWRSGHVGIYIGNNQYIHSPHTGDVVKIVNGANGKFTYALQFY